MVSSNFPIDPSRRYWSGAEFEKRCKDIRKDDYDIYIHDPSQLVYQAPRELRYMLTSKLSREPGQNME